MSEGFCQVRVHRRNYTLVSKYHSFIALINMDILLGKVVDRARPLGYIPAT
jgi:hypothetical protein